MVQKKEGNKAIFHADPLKGRLRTDTRGIAKRVKFLYRHKQKELKYLLGRGERAKFCCTSERAYEKPLAA